MKAVIYVRVSTREQAEEGYSLAAQQAACSRYVADKGWDLAETYTDRGESARTADRPQFQLMLNRIREDGSVKYLVVHKLDRLARNVKDYATVREMLEKAGVQLVSVTEGLEATASGKMVEGMLAVVAEWYSNNLSHEIRKGQDQKLREGGWPTIAPIGYRNVRLDTGAGSHRGRATIVPDEQAPLVRRAFELYATGQWSLTRLARELRTRGLRNRRGGPMTRSGLCDTLKNVAYIGKVPWKGLVHDGAHKPIVSNEVFQQVQEFLASHERAKERQRTHVHFLKGVLRCGSCGRRLLFNPVKGRNQRDFAYFTCASNFNDKPKCGEPSVPVEVVEDLVEDIYRRIKLPDGIEDEIELFLEAEVNGHETHRAHETQFVAKRLQRLATDKDRLLDLFLAGDIDRETFRERKSKIDSEVIELESRIGDQTQQIKQTRELMGRAIYLARNCLEGYQGASYETKRLYNLAFFAEVVVKDRAIARTTYQDPFRALFAAEGRDVLNKELQVEVNGLEPSASALRTQRSTN